MTKTEKYALDAKIIVDGIAFIEYWNGYLVVDLDNIRFKATIDRGMNITTTNMPDKTVEYLKHIVDINRRFLV